MDISYRGANCIVITNKKERLVVDDNLSELGLSTASKDGDVLIYTKLDQNKPDGVKSPKFTVSSPGEYEISGFSIEGIPARAHMDEKGKKQAIIYKLVVDDIRIVVLGHIHPDLSDTQLEEIGTVDILITPVGGNGFTLDSTGAISLVRKISPKIVTPSHYSDSKIKYEVPQADLGEALKNMSMEASETLDSYKPKNLETIENTRLIVLKRQ